VNKWGLTILALLAAIPAAAAIALSTMRLSDAAGLVLLLLATVSSVPAAKGGTRWSLVVSGVAAVWTGTPRCPFRCASKTKVVWGDHFDAADSRLPIRAALGSSHSPRGAAGGMLRRCQFKQIGV
jgi:hypothetical protein